MEEEPETGERRATPFRSTNFYKDPLEIDELDQLDPDPISRPPVLVPRNRIQVPQPAVEQEEGVINNPIVEQPANELSDQVAPIPKVVKMIGNTKDCWFKGSWKHPTLGRIDLQTQILNKQHDRLTRIK